LQAAWFCDLVELEVTLSRTICKRFGDCR
jgi:hypothetical protein